MTLDSLTRLQAEAKHSKVKNSLVRASAEFREHFQDATELFHSLPTSARVAGGATAGLSSAPSSSLQSPHNRATFVHPLTDDLVRIERLAQCCKRVRIWRRQIANPLLQYKNPSMSTTSSANGSNAGKKSERRMHITLLMALIVDMYEQRMHFEVDESSTVGIQETFPEFVVRMIAQRTASRRAAVDQLSSVVATVLQAAANHHRVHLFGSLCGLDDKFNPPERIKMFLHVLERLHRWKTSMGGTGSGTGLATPAASGHTASSNSSNSPNSSGTSSSSSSDTAMSTIVFHTIGIPQLVVQQVVVDLFADDYYWNFQFWHAQCSELHVDYRWPPQASDELQERALALAVSSRITLLNNTRKVDGDAFLELVMDAWTDRATAICALLEAATDSEEEKRERTLQQRQQVQDARANVLPLTDREVQLFDTLVDEFWNADVPWSSPSVQRRITPVGHVRPLHELKELYRSYVASLDASRKSWDWLGHWRWDTEWEWGVLHIVEDDDEN